MLGFVGLVGRVVKRAAHDIAYGDAVPVLVPPATSGSSNSAAIPVANSCTPAPASVPDSQQLPSHHDERPRERPAGTSGADVAGRVAVPRDSPDAPPTHPPAPTTSGCAARPPCSPSSLGGGGDERGRGGAGRQHEGADGGWRGRDNSPISPPPPPGRWRPAHRRRRSTMVRADPTPRRRCRIRIRRVGGGHGSLCRRFCASFG